MKAASTAEKVEKELDESMRFQRKEPDAATTDATLRGIWPVCADYVGVDHKQTASRVLFLVARA
jgi:hypothetical protein